MNFNVRSGYQTKYIHLIYKLGITSMVPAADAFEDYLQQVAAVP